MLGMLQTEQEGSKNLQSRTPQQYNKKTGKNRPGPGFEVLGRESRKNMRKAKEHAGKKLKILGFQGLIFLLDLFLFLFWVVIFSVTFLRNFGGGFWRSSGLLRGGDFWWKMHEHIRKRKENYTAIRENPTTIPTK